METTFEWKRNGRDYYFDSEYEYNWFREWSYDVSANVVQCWYGYDGADTVITCEDWPSGEPLARKQKYAQLLLILSSIYP